MSSMNKFFTWMNSSNLVWDLHPFPCVNCANSFAVVRLYKLQPLNVDVCDLQHRKKRFSLTIFFKCDYTFVVSLSLWCQKMTSKQTNIPFDRFTCDKFFNKEQFRFLDEIQTRIISWWTGFGWWVLFRVLRLNRLNIVWMVFHWIVFPFFNLVIDNLEKSSILNFLWSLIQ
jgi:hypothetical protein